MSVDFDAVIIGSGFGGSINALRLAEARKSVLVLERGKRYEASQFPRNVRDVNKLFWRYPRNYESRGLYDVRFFSGIGAVVASGVGGGSLIYANIHIRPDASVFEDPRWPCSINRASLEPYYDRVARVLRVSPVPQTEPFPKRDAFHAAAAQMGRKVFDPDQAVDWNVCTGGSQCEFGCPHGAKNTIDKTYLSEAEKSGARVRVGTQVTHIEPVVGGYRVHYIDIDSGGRGSVTAKRVVVSAGTLGTNEILLRSREETGTLPGLSDRLGHGYSGNGDFLGSVQNAARDLGPDQGPDVTSVIRFDEKIPFTMAAPGFCKPVFAVLASLGQLNGRWLRCLGPLVWPFMGEILPWVFEKGFLSNPVALKGPHAGDPSRMTNLFAIGRDNANGKLRLKRGRLDIEWKYARENRELTDSMTAAMGHVGRSYGGTFAPLVTWGMFQRIITVHSLGGCALSDTPREGVVSPLGEVHGYPGLYVADGSVIPTAIGFHPVMTISAVSEHIAETVVGSISV